MESTPAATSRPTRPRSAARSTAPAAEAGVIGKAESPVVTAMFLSLSAAGLAAG